MATSNKDFKIKNGLIVEGSSATVNGNDVLTSASSINDLDNVSITTPADSQVLAYEAATSLWKNVNASGGSSVTISETAPESPVAGNVWYNSAEGRAYIYYDSSWVDLNPGIAGPTGPAGADSTVPGPTGPTGETGATGATGAAGPGVASGGTAGQILTKVDSTDYNTSWEDIAESAAVISSTTAPENTSAIWYNTENGNAYIYYDSFWTSVTGPGLPVGGTTGQVLAKTSAADYATEWVAPSGLELVKAQAIGTAVSGITVTDAFSSKYDNYRIVISGATIATSLTLSIRMGLTATGYYGGSIRVTTASVSSAEGQSNATAYEVGIGAVGTNSPSMTLDILGPFTATKTTFFATSVNSIASAAGGARWNNGWLNNTTSYTDFTFVTGGTITGGTVYVYGYRKA